MLSRIISWIKRLAISVQKLTLKILPYFIPSRAGWRGAAYGIIVLICLKLVITAALYLNKLDIHVIVLYVMKSLLMGFLSGLAVYVIFFIYKKIPVFFAWVAIGAVIVLMDFWPVSDKGKALITIISILTGSLLAGGAFSIHRNWKQTGWINRIINLGCLFAGVSSLIIGGIFIFREGVCTDPPVNAALGSDYSPMHISLADPSIEGEYRVLDLTYGSGKDRHRPEFGEEIDIRTDSVDGSRFVSNWEKLHGKARTRYYGFDQEYLPLNARVWYPDGSGPFPLVLIVHGNHLDQDYSDPGYEYLGRLMASRGFIFASVDENFINGAWYDIFDHLTEENDCRGWLLLKHLEIWHEWNRDPASVFFNRVDTSSIALMGHSRGGEAVAIAACFNRLPYYPDDATVVFDFNFSIRSIIAIAPVDGQYQPAKSGTRFSNVDYFVIHGSNDMDMQSYHGMRQMQRIDFDDGNYHFKAGLYVFGANHGQFNTLWGRDDVSPPGIAMYNRKQIMPGEDQQRIAMVYFSAFLEATLKDRKEYIQLFQDYRRGIDWLPETVYLNQFEDSRCEILCDFQEDIDLSSTSLDGGFISMENLTVWKERTVPMKWGAQDTRAVYLGWNQKEKDSLLASFTMQQSPKIGIRTDSTYSLYFLLADANEDSNPHPEDDDKKGKENQNGKNDRTGENDLNGEDDTNNNTVKVEIDKESDEKDEEDNDIRKAIDFSIELTDSIGISGCLLLSSISALQPQLEIKLMKADLLSDNPKGEVVFQNYLIPLMMFQKSQPDLDITCIRSIRFIFNRTEEGVVILDNIGFRKDATFDNNRCL